MSGFRGGRRFDDSGRLLHFSELPDTFAWQELKDLCKAYGRVIRADVNRCVLARSQIAAASPRYSPLLRYIVNPHSSKQDRVCFDPQRWCARAPLHVELRCFSRAIDLNACRRDHVFHDRPRAPRRRRISRRRFDGPI